MDGLKNLGNDMKNFDYVPTLINGGIFVFWLVFAYFFAGLKKERKRAESYSMLVLSLISPLAFIVQISFGKMDVKLDEAIPSVCLFYWVLSLLISIFSPILNSLPHKAKTVILSIFGVTFGLAVFSFKSVQKRVISLGGFVNEKISVLADKYKKKE